MTQLQHLIRLKRASTTFDGLDRYVHDLYTAAHAWAPDAPPGIAILILDGLIDTAARDRSGTERASERSHSPERDADAPAQDPTPQTGSYGPERLTAERAS